MAGICPSIEDPTDCEVRQSSLLVSSFLTPEYKTRKLCLKANLPGFWAGIAALLWPEYWNPEVGQETFSPSKLSLEQESSKTVFYCQLFKGRVDVRSHVCRPGGHQHDLRRLQDGNPCKELHRENPE